MVCGAGGQQMVYAFVVGAAVIETLASLDLAYPKVDEETQGTSTAKKKLVSK